ncbi:family 20 glycosylhydrolase [Flavobacterium antarcticum]|uniref:family 20 glycosylhydrolase n=1 Tax=Flavobacterium antarcticum TaxID=271155 RepID=UPI0003B41587|nr:family 20 glycosylhydrolase [Flavobacterium antarcticum]
MRILQFFIVLLISNFCLAQKEPLIPMPKNIEYQADSFSLNPNTVIQVADVKAFEALFLKENIKVKTGLDLKITTKPISKNAIKLVIEEVKSVTDLSENYNLIIDKSNIQITASANQGLFYGIQTLLQSIPFEKTKNAKIASVKIKDQPKFKWRGMHLDVGRHFFPKEFIKKYIDYIAMYKMNTFHWHLTEDQGWRIEIKKYPKLTEVGAWRKGSMIEHYNDQKFDTIKHGGFYTQDEVKDIVAYAKKRHVTIVPEIEMPGHSLAALAAYPEFSCTGGPFEVAKIWGVLEDVYCPKEETFTFLEDVLTEVIALFPSEYIHIGGDESPKTRWKACSHCQNLIKEKGLKDEHELQSYFINRIEKFLNSKGRQIIGWDEILEGGLAPNAAVMSWRGTEGGIIAAKDKHYVVMTPGSHVYFDHYQGEPKNEPIAIGGYTPLEKVYSFNPIPDELTADEAKYILGAQANVWSEYIPTTKQVEYMIMPRMAALSEVLWETSNPKNYKEFEKRIIQHFDFYEKMGINYSKSIFEVTSAVLPSDKGVAFELKSPNPSGIRYTTDGSEPVLNSFSYTKPISITENTTVKANYFEEGKVKSATIEQDFFINKSTGKKIELVAPPHENYSIGGSFTLVDGMVGNPSKYGRDWLGFWGKDLNATIDLGATETISKIKINTLLGEGSWIYFPKEIQFLVSEDGKNFKTIQTISQKEISQKGGRIEVNFPKTKAKFVKVIAVNNGIIADGMPGAGSQSWLFVDEISIE